MSQEVYFLLTMQRYDEKTVCANNFDKKEQKNASKLTLINFCARTQRQNGYFYPFLRI